LTTRAVIFDLDGCLVDSEPHSLRALAEELQAAVLSDVSEADLGERFLGVSLAVILDWAAGRAGRPLPDAFATRFEARLLASYRDGLKVIDGVPQLLDRLVSDDIDCAIATGGSVRRMNETLRISGLESRFAGRAFSADEVAQGKPAPDLFELAAQRLGVPAAACVVLEDSPHGIEGAKRAGMRAIGFTGGSHLDGRRDSHADLLREKGAESVLRHMEGMAEALLAPLRG
jgi:beta-phosphoglucomutase-like phosphatase (HAD superfamily)